MILSLIVLTLATTYVASNKCYSGWEEFKGNCYGVGDEFVPWFDAQQLCEMYASNLVTLENQEENDFVVRLLKGKNTGNVWTAGSERHHRGVWEWIPSRKPFGKFADWYGNEPLGAFEDCLILWAPGGYKWADATCTSNYRFVCKRSTL